MQSLAFKAGAEVNRWPGAHSSGHLPNMGDGPGGRINQANNKAESLDARA